MWRDAAAAATLLPVRLKQLPGDSACARWWLTVACTPALQRAAVPAVSRLQSSDAKHACSSQHPNLPTWPCPRLHCCGQLVCSHKSSRARAAVGAATLQIRASKQHRAGGHPLKARDACSPPTGACSGAEHAPNPRTNPGCPESTQGAQNRDTADQMCLCNPMCTQLDTCEHELRAPSPMMHARRASTLPPPPESHPTVQPSHNVRCRQAPQTGHGSQGGVATCLLQSHVASNRHETNVVDIPSAYLIFCRATMSEMPPPVSSAAEYCLGRHSSIRWTLESHKLQSYKVTFSAAGSNQSRSRCLLLTEGGWSRASSRLLQSSRLARDVMGPDL
jgi:hypothetical protein